MTQNSPDSGVPYPPESLREFVGAGDFVAVGNHWKRFLLGSAGLEPTHRVLDAGCGIGRMAIPLTEVLGDQGSYEGFDVVAQAIDWCSQNITPKYPNFRFQHSDVVSRHYNPHGRYKASEFRFPFADGEFDLVLLTSVFTHLLPDDMENYFSEIARVLKPGGRSVITYFLLNDQARDLMVDNGTKLQFTHPVSDVCATVKPDDPERAIAFDEAYVLNLYTQYGLEILYPIQYGAWCGRKPAPRHQDVIQAARR